MGETSGNTNVDDAADTAVSALEAFLGTKIDSDDETAMKSAINALRSVMDTEATGGQSPHSWTFVPKYSRDAERWPVLDEADVTYESADGTGFDARLKVRPEFGSSKFFAN